MGLKDLIFKNSNEGEDEKEVKTGTSQTSFKNKFPSNAYIAPKKGGTTVAAPVQTSTAITPDNPACAPHLDKIMELYESGFDGLNLPGYDFYEFFKSVVGGGINNPAVYDMAFNMAKGMDDTVNKPNLLTQSQHYIDEINKVHQHYANNGDQKRSEAATAKAQEELALTNELSNIDSEISRLTELRANKRIELLAIDSKYSPQITDIECKLMANDMARESIIGTIQTVVNGINKNI